jgi:23S rRNA U2552 (ribose-2'-O)-methylase RlmE/FtsJ
MPGRFLNRSALKLVELDYIYIIIDTNNKNSSNTFTFLDVCGGPGGFVQHILTKCSLNSIRCVGVGMSLRMSEADDKQEMSSCDWDINHLHTPPQVAIHHNDNQRQVLEDNDPISTCNFYIEDGPTRSGDLYMEANRNALQKRVNDMSHGNGVDLVTADGGFDLNPIRMERELFPLILAQVAAMLPTLRMGGTFILKIFSCNEVIHLVTSLIITVMMSKSSYLCYGLACYQ